MYKNSCFSDKCFYAVTDTLATPGTPVATDFAGLYFRINQAVTEFNNANYINNTQVVVQQPNARIDLTVASPTLSVPVEFFANTNSYIDYKVSIKNELATGTTNQQILITIGGTEFVLGVLEADNQSTVNFLVQCYYITSTSVRVIVEQLSRNLSIVKELTVSVSPTTTLDFEISGYLNDNTSGGNFQIIGQSIKAVNPLKTTC